MSRFGLDVSVRDEFLNREFDSYEELIRLLESGIDLERDVYPDPDRLARSPGIITIKRKINDVPTEPDGKEYLFSELLDTFKRKGELSRIGKHMLFLQGLFEIRGYLDALRRRNDVVRERIGHISFSSDFILTSDLSLWNPQAIFLRMEVERDPNLWDRLQGRDGPISVGVWYHNVEEPDLLLDLEEYQKLHVGEPVLSVAERMYYLSVRGRDGNWHRVIPFLDVAFTSFFVPSPRWLLELQERIQERTGEEVERQIKQRGEEEKEVVREIVVEVWKELYAEKCGDDTPPDALIEIGKILLAGFASGFLFRGVYDLVAREIEKRQGAMGQVSPADRMTIEILSDIKTAIEQNQKHEFLTRLESKRTILRKQERILSEAELGNFVECKFCRSLMPHDVDFCPICQKSQH